MKTLASLKAQGWQVKHDKGTAFVSLCHPSGGAMSLIEVKTYGSGLTLDEADQLANRIAEILQAEPAGPRASQSVEIGTTKIDRSSVVGSNLGEGDQQKTETHKTDGATPIFWFVIGMGVMKLIQWMGG